MGQGAYTIDESQMSQSPAMKILTVVLAGIALVGHSSPVVASILLCIGEDTVSDCCRNPDVSRQLLDEADCDCCIVVDGLPSTMGTPFPEATLDVVAGSADLHSVVPPSSLRLPRAMSDDAPDARLSSLRTIVLRV